MNHYLDDPQFLDRIHVTDEVVTYIQGRMCDFRICTTCGGPILLPVTLKPPKPTDLQIRAGDHRIFISIHQFRYLHTIDMGMVPHLAERESVGEVRRAVHGASAYGGCHCSGDGPDFE